MDVTTMWETLKKDYGITSMDELTAALKNSKGINIGVFTEKRRNGYDSERIPGETERRITA